MMLRSFLVALASASIALSPIAATPARAANDDLAKILGGLALLGVVGAVIESKRKDPPPVTRAPSHPVTPPRAGRDESQRAEERERDRRHGRAEQLPGQCRVLVPTRQGTTVLYDRPCLESRMRRADRLPRQCLAWSAGRRGGPGHYDAACLRRAGWSEAAPTWNRHDGPGGDRGRRGWRDGRREDRRDRWHEDRRRH